jgi:aminoglycoside 3-N-acetyltransferase
VDLFIHNKQAVSAQHIADALRKVGVAQGDTVFVHSSIMHFGMLATAHRSQVLLAIATTLQQAVGNEGTVIVPTFSYSFTKNEVFDVQNTKSTVGDLSNFFRKMPDVVRNEQPLFSVAAWGRHKDAILQIGTHTFDERSIFGIIHQKLNAKILMLGAAFYDHCSFMHHIEYMAGVPYRTPKNYTGIVIKADGSRYQTTTQFTVRDLVLNPIINGTNLKNHLKKMGAFVETPLGAGNIELVHTTPLYSEGYELICQNPYYLLQ